MLQTKKHTIIATLLVLILVFQMFSSAVAAAEGNGMDSVGILPMDSMNVLDESSEPLIEPVQIPQSEIPLAVGSKQSQQHGFARRAREREQELNQVVFQNQNGLYTEYVFAYPIKYINGAGVVVDKTAEIGPCNDNNFSYQTINTDVVLRFGATAQVGVELNTDRMNIKMIPVQVLSNNVGATSQVSLINSPATMSQTLASFSGSELVETDAVSYALNSLDTVSFISSYTGLQMKISHSAGSSTDAVAFFLYTGGLTLVEREDTLTLFNNAGDMVAVVGDLISDNGALVSFSFEAIKPGQLYLLHAEIPELPRDCELLASVSQTYNSIQDASLYSQNQTAYGSSKHLFIGRVNSGIGRAVIRPTTWYLTSTNTPGVQIISATLTVRDVMGSDPPAVVECRQFTGSVWYESSATWNSVGGANFGSSVLDQYVMSSEDSWDRGYYFHYNVTSLIQQWYAGTASWLKGVVLKGDSTCEASSTIIEKTLASAQYSTAAYRPYFTVTYQDNAISSGVYRITQNAVSLYLTFESDNGIFDTKPTVGSVDDCERIDGVMDVRQQLFYVHGYGDGTYIIRPLVYTRNVLSLNDSGSLSSMRVDYQSTVPASARWFITSVEGGYMIVPATDTARALRFNRSDSISAYLKDTTDNDQIWTFTESTNVERELLAYNATTGEFSDTPTLKLYVGESLNLATEGFVVSVCSDSILSEPDMIPGLLGADISTDGILTAESEGAGYITYEYYDSNEMNYLSLDVYVEIETLEGERAFINRKTGRYMDVLNQALMPNADVCQWEYRSENSAKWVLSHLGEGYYTIRAASSTASNPFYLTESDGEIYLHNGTSISENMKWKIVRTSGGGYRIESKARSDEGYVLTVSNSNSNINGNLLIAQCYTANESFEDEWIISLDRGIVITSYYETEELDSKELECFEIAYGLLSDLFSAYDIAFARGEAQIPVLLNSLLNPDCYADPDNFNRNEDDEEHKGPPACHCSSECENHCTNLQRILNEFSSNRQYNHINVFLADRSDFFCFAETDGGHNLITGGLCARIGDPDIAMVGVAGEGKCEIVAKIALTLAHEIAHSFGMREIAEIQTSTHDENADEYCVMSYAEQCVSYSYLCGILDGTLPLFCESCSDAFSELIS